MSFPNLGDLISHRSKDFKELQYFGGESYHMGRKHVYLDFDLTETCDKFNSFYGGTKDPSYIGEHHRVHIFFSHMNECIKNDKLAEFVEKCSQITNRPVIIHVPRSRSLLVKLVKGTVYGLNNCKIIEEDDDKQSEFINKGYGNPTDITIGWNLEGGKT